LADQNQEAYGDKSLQIDITDALSEKDKVKFTIQTKTSLKTFKEPQLNVTREHEEFIWLHDRYIENDEFAGVIVRRFCGSRSRLA
jgi:sorting nexin-5/6/32